MEELIAKRVDERSESGGRRPTGSVGGAGARRLSIDQVGIDRATAEKVIAFLEEHDGEAVALLSKSGLKDKLPGGLGDKLGGLR